MKRIICVLLVISICFCASGCKSSSASDLTEGIKPSDNQSYVVDDSNAMKENQIRFSLELFKACSKADKGNNQLISPLSVYIALSMVANGADGDTEKEMTTMLGASSEALSAYLKSYTGSLPSSENYKTEIANSVWLRDDSDRLKVEEAFLQKTVDYFGAGVYKATFDNSTVKAINNWVKDNTDGMIDKIVEDISDDAVVFLINALVFDAKWQTMYERSMVESGVFYSYDNKVKPATMMYSNEGYFLKSENATGFKKDYKDGKYSFVGILPNKGIDIYDFIESGEIIETLASEREESVYVGIPKFGYDYSITMNNILKEMGMPSAFSSSKANFKNMATSSRGNIFISDVLHKTHIEVGEEGTKAAAVTKVEFDDESAMIIEGNSVVLNRPFIYMIMDNSNDLPLFIGTVIDIVGD